MKTVSHYLKGLSFALAALAYAGAASAEDHQAPVGPADAGETETLSAEEMEDLSGGTATTWVITNQTLTATNSGNSVTGDVVGSGQVNLGAGAFSGYDGVGNFVINTGHNNNLQSSVNVSVALTPPEVQ